MDGVGKTSLAKTIGETLRAVLIFVDDHVDKNKGGYIEYIRCSELHDEISRATVPLIIIEGVCLRAVAEHCKIDISMHVYVRRLSRQGIWHDEEVCCPTESADVLKEKARGLREDMSHIFSGAPAQQDHFELGLEGELIDYHSMHRPVEKADIVFDVVERGGDGQSG